MRISDWSSDVCSSDLREIADRLARLAKSLEAAGHAPKSVASFLMRCLFTMFAEDVELLTKGSFRRLLASLRGEEIGRASCRERVCQYVEISVVAVSLKK